MDAPKWVCSRCFEPANRTPAPDEVYVCPKCGTHGLKCLHANFKVVANVGRILHDEKEPPAYYSVDIWLTCNDCQEPFVWHGLPNGFSPYRPTVSLDGHELHVPAMPRFETIQPGLPGYSVTHVVPEGEEPTKQ